MGPSSKNQHFAVLGKVKNETSGHVSNHTGTSLDICQCVSVPSAPSRLSIRTKQSVSPAATSWLWMVLFSSLISHTSCSCCSTGAVTWAEPGHKWTSVFYWGFLHGGYWRLSLNLRNEIKSYNFDPRTARPLERLEIKQETHDGFC